MPTSTRQLVQKLWSFCDLLRDDGITYQDYITELTWLLFLRLAAEVPDSPTSARTPVHAWTELRESGEADRLRAYKKELARLARSDDPTVADIFSEARSAIRHPAVFAALFRAVDSLDWADVDNQSLGDMYEGLLERNASEQKAGAGQYFTPRPVVRLMVEALAPRMGETVQDPAAGTGGFLVAAHEAARQRRPKRVLVADSTDDTTPSYFGVELVASAHRLCLMNLWLHRVPARVEHGDALTHVGRNLPKADVILTNPPFGVKRGAAVVDRPDLPFATNNKQLVFLQHVYTALKPGGRAAVVVPDGVLFEGGVARAIRQDLLRTCDLHTILRLPQGIFYAQGVRTNVLFLRRRVKAGTQDATKQVWIYDARSSTLDRARSPEVDEFISRFVTFYRATAVRREQLAGDNPRTIRRLSRAEIMEHRDQLDLAPEELSQQDVPAPLDDVAELRRLVSRTTDLIEELEHLLAAGEPR